MLTERLRSNRLARRVYRSLPANIRSLRHGRNRGVQLACPAISQRLRASTRPPATDPRRRLVTSPVFVLCSVRSGSTLLRVLLNSHSQICAPHELHLRYLRVHVEQPYARKSVELLGLDARELEHMLWDQMLYRQLMASGKPVVVDKSPSNTGIWPRLVECWPDARFIFLLRHPAAIVASYMRGHDDRTVDRSARHIRGYLERIEAARAELPGVTIRYESLTSEPERETRRICAFLGVDWQRQMLDYGAYDHGPFKAGVGDWSKQIRSGRITPARDMPSDVPDELRDIARAWGYLDGEASPDA